MTGNLTIFLDWKAADDILQPIRKLCDPSRRYSFEAYFREHSIEVRAIDCGPVPKEMNKLVQANAETRPR